MSSDNALVPHGGSKISPVHRQRLACIYVRQSSFKQVRENTESQVYQYRLQERAKALGWPESQIRVIDSDQGISGKSSDGRLGFQEIISLVSLGKVGIIFGYEVSRLARNNADWYPLLDLAAMFGVLIADNDGVYDPKQFNDRLLLGLKGTMSEVELHLLRQRLDAGRMNTILRAEYRQPLPTGLVRLRDGTVMKDPDEQIRTTMQLVLDKFAELGSCTKVVRYLLDQHLLLPRRQSGGPLDGEMLWKEPAYSAIYAIVKNPAYAGAFAHGRTQVDPARRVAVGNPRGGRTMRGMDQWIHLQQAVYPAYISWEQYLANQEQLRQNAVTYEHARHAVQGTAREGAALLQGLVRCGCCACRMHVRYRSTPTYACAQLYDSFNKKSCLFITAPKIDEVVVQAFFAAIQPAQLDALAELLKQQQQEQQQLDQQWQQRLQRTTYEALRAERQYQSVDPENRLVAATLEKRWEETLLALRQTEQEYQQFQQQQATPSITPERQAQFRHLSETLPQLWPQLPNPQKKELLRTLISQVVLTPKELNQVEVKIVWLSGHYSLLTVHRPLLRWEDAPHYDQLLERIQQLWAQGVDDLEIAQTLNHQGFVDLQNEPLSRLTVRNLRLNQGWSVRPASGKTPPLVDGRHTARGLALACDTDDGWIRTCILNGTIDPALVSRHPHQRCYLIDAAPELIERLRQLAAQRKRYKKRTAAPSPAPLTTDEPPLDPSSCVTKCL
jgi:DNA invertase Pin-like site-specific DNA recombinase